MASEQWFAAVPGLALTSQTVLLLLVYLAGLLLLAVLFGAFAARVGLPRVMGELLVGVVLGPSVLGLLPSGATEWLPQHRPSQLAALEAVGQVGILLLVALVAAELDLVVLRRHGRASIVVAALGVLLPFTLGVGSSFLLPGSFRGSGTSAPTFALFLGTALSVSAIPVIAKILCDMGLHRCRSGQMIIVAAVFSDVVGWLLLSVLTAATAGGSAVTGILAALGALLGTIAVALTFGRWAVPRILRSSGRSSEQRTAVIVILVLACAAATQALHLEAVLGAFLCGALVADAELPAAALDGLRTVVLSVLAPLFFALAGLRVDLTLLGRPSVLVAGVGVLAVAVGGKVLGAYLGGRLARLSHPESLVLGIGLNARGVIEIIIATIGVNLHILTDASYTVIVLVAITTSLMTPPLLRPVISRLDGSGDLGRAAEAVASSGRRRAVRTRPAGRPGVRSAAWTGTRRRRVRGACPGGRPRPGGAVR